MVQQNDTEPAVQPFDTMQEALRHVWEREQHGHVYEGTAAMLERAFFPPRFITSPAVTVTELRIDRSMVLPEADIHIDFRPPGPLERITELLDRADAGEFAVKGRDFGRGVAFMSKLVRELIT